MDIFEAFPEGSQAIDFAASNGVSPEVPHILWEALKKSGFVIRHLESISSRLYANDSYLNASGLSHRLGSSLSDTDESLVRKLRYVCEVVSKHPDADDDLTVEHLTHIAGLWMSSGVLTVTWESVINSSAEDCFGYGLSPAQVDEAVRILKSAEPRERRYALVEHFGSRLDNSRVVADDFARLLMIRMTPFL